MLGTAKRTLSPQHLAALQAGRARALERAAQPVEVVTATDIPTWEIRSPVRKFHPDMIDDWLLGRLERIWPGWSRATWRSRFLSFTQSNEYLMICNDRAVLLAECRQQPMSGKAIVWEIFAWSRDAEDGWLVREKGQALFALYDRCLDWMNGMRGERAILGVCGDIRGDTIARMYIEHGKFQGGPLVDILG